SAGSAAGYSAMASAARTSASALANGDCGDFTSIVDPLRLSAAGSSGRHLLLGTKLNPGSRGVSLHCSIANQVYTRLFAAKRWRLGVRMLRSMAGLLTAGRGWPCERGRRRIPAPVPNAPYAGTKVPVVFPPASEGVLHWAL